MNKTLDPSTPTPSGKTLIAAFVWLVTVAFGLTILMRYGQTPGDSGEPPAVWPASSTLPSPEAKARLVMLVHPKCPCSRAGLAELERLAARVQGKMDGYVLFFEPGDVTTDWSRTDLWTTAKRIPGIQVLADPNGVEAARFGALTSGQTLVYDRGGALLFAGGITPSRGHEGDNIGKSAVIAALSGALPPVETNTVYGCAMNDPEACMKDKDTP